MGIRTLSLIALLSLTNCASKGKVVVIDAPNDPHMHVVGYQTAPIFTGFEFTAGIPALSFVPIVGPYLAEAVRFKAGSHTTLVIPIIQEEQHEAHSNCPPRMSAPYPWVQVTPPDNHR